MSLHNFWDKGPSTYLAYILSFGPVCFRHLSFFSFVLAPHPFWPTPRICSWASSLYSVYCRYWPSSRILFSQVILTPMTFNPINIAQHLRQLLQSELFPRPLMLSMPGCNLITCC